ncbi:SDR family oxidoreductase [Corynebacterium propinquum]|uniref:SDR family oxidoreductase n=1 Tax=Corynebacterium propinquum TaxID=43769 RepID=UPI0026703F86|nr:SDR family oxidoreductase [Corynebacterium propinquum]WKS31545.1 SDR family oxidoreductase [Corynebacterium propinquum]WKS35921.1 SDR family oxidoreductase [Corynebacterium propinquum]WKS37957.1 SDR family oxidoreductase [Corynebacterium propinquum]WKS42357.1 SDR family oxidoreductase [Corynebacterium propinquum]WKS46533.1 SDR family oxidoreductase [Corynebacterium propinquum]
MSAAQNKSTNPRTATSNSPTRATPRSIFVSGGATGIGKAVATKFLDAGWVVGAYDIDDERLQQFQSEYPQLIIGHLDVTDAAQWEDALADFTAHTDGTLTVLDNNAGVIGFGDITEQDPDLIAAQVSINCTGVTLGARAAHQYLKKTPGAHLVNMGSASSIYGQPHIVPYSASKFYVQGLSQALDLEWENDDIRVVNIMPLWAKTKLSSGDAQSIKRLGVHLTPEQVADKIWQAVHPSHGLTRRRIMYSVGLPSLLLRYAARFAPSIAVRFMNKLIAQ